MFGTAVGSAYLASLEDAEVARLVDRARIPSSDLPAIYSVLSRIRTIGLAEGVSDDGAWWTLGLLLPRHFVYSPTVLGMGSVPEEVRNNMAELGAIMREVVKDHFRR